MTDRWLNAKEDWRFLTAVGLLLMVMLANLLVAQWRAPFEVNYDARTSFEIAEREKWIKGAPLIIAKNFGVAEVVNVGEGVPESFVFERTLADIYDVGADYSAPPVDLKALAPELGQALAPYVQHQSEVFCNYEQAKYCDLQIAWQPRDLYPTPMVFVAVVLSDGHFGLIESGLLDELVASLIGTEQKAEQP